jgi:DNA-binding IclR family transcriptional regulator
MADVRATQLETLRVIAAGEPCTIAGLAEKLGIPRSSASNRLMRLRNQKLATFSYGRGSQAGLCVLTEAGQELLRAEVTP